MTRSYGTAMVRLQLMAMMDHGVKQYTGINYIPMGQMDEAALILLECHEKLKELGGKGVIDDHRERPE